jgi:hypothetical protein
MVIKSYFDGSNKPDPDRYTNLTLASLSGMLHEWKSFEALWGRTLTKHGADFLHTTDAVSLQNGFTTQKGWNRNRVNALLLDCAKALRSKCSVQVGGHIHRMGLRPCVVRIEFADYLLAQYKIGNDMPLVTDIVAQQAIAYCGAWWQFRNGHFLDAIFNSNEPYCGHIVDRLNSSLGTSNFPLLTKLRCKEASMEHTPALQASGLLAWSVSHREAVKESWHQLVLGLPRDGDYFDYNKLLDIDPAALLEITSYNLPPRERKRRTALRSNAVAS